MRKAAQDRLAQANRSPWSWTTWSIHLPSLIGWKVNFWLAQFSGELTQLENIASAFDLFDIESYEDDELEILFTIESEIDELVEMNFDLMKNKIAISAFYNQIDNSTKFILSDLEEDDCPKKVKKYAKIIFYSPSD